jgi:hypothetical protein
MHPVEFAALEERWMEDQRRQDFRAGTIASQIVNGIRSFGKKSASRVTPEDFFASLKATPDRRKEMSSDAMLRIVEQLNVSMHGQDLRKRRG